MKIKRLKNKANKTKNLTGIKTIKNSVITL